MSSFNYLEINSNYRDRTLWPLAGNFDVPISQTGRKSKLVALDPVSLGTPITSWTSNRIDANTSGPQLSGNVDTVVASDNIAATSDNSVFIITSSTGNLQQSNGYYVGLILNNTTTGDFRRIEEYEYLGTDLAGVNDRALVTVKPSFPDTFTFGNAITINDPTDISNTSNPLFFIPSGRSGSNAYPNCILYNESLNEFRQISGYSPITHVLKVDATTPVVGWLLNHNYSIRKDQPLLNTTIGVGPTTTTVVITGGSTTDDFYNGDFIRIKPVVYGNSVSTPEAEIRRIVDYTGATQTAIVSPPFSASPVAASSIEILYFSYDNLNPFVYNGSLVSQQEMVCYQIELLNLVLPNQILNGGSGSRIAFYPYVYVELTNVSGASSGAKNIIYSNNPNATKMLFRCAIDDVPLPIISSFLKIDGDGMVQTIKFKPNDTLHFSVRLSNGDVYDTILPEHTSPSPPNELTQISALFSLRKL